MPTKTRTRTGKAEKERDLIILRLAESVVGPARSLFYEDLADLYGDLDLFTIASNLRTRGLIGWGTNWTLCWLTEEGERVMETQSYKAA